MDDEVPDFPKFLNEAERMIYWTFGEVFMFGAPMLFIALFGIGLLGIASIPVGLMVGYLSYYLFRFLGETPSFGDIRPGLMYWCLPDNEAILPSHIREFL